MDVEKVDADNNAVVVDTDVVVVDVNDDKNDNDDEFASRWIIVSYLCTY